MSEEYIRKQDAVDTINVNADDLEQNGSIPYVQGARAMAIVVEQMSPADVVPVIHGRWIWKPTKQYCPPDCWYPPINHEETWNEKDGTWLEDEMYCSECNYHNFREVKFNFCPECGAKMDGKGEE